MDESAQLVRQLAHQSDWHWVCNFGQYDEYVDHDQILTVIKATRGHHSIWLSSNNPPFDNVNVRQAIFKDIDRDDGIKVLLDGHGSTGFMMAPGSPWELEEAVGCGVLGWCSSPDGNMDQWRLVAKALLEDEGFDFNKTYTFTVESDEQVQARATFIQGHLDQLGVKTDFDTVETTAYRGQTAQGSWGDILPRNDTMPADDRALGMGYYFRCSSIQNHWTPVGDCDTAMEDLLDQAATATDLAARLDISNQIQLLGMDLYWKFPLYWEQEAVTFWPEVRSYAHHPHPSGSFRRYEQVWIDQSHAGDTGNSGQVTGPPGGI